MNTTHANIAMTILKRYIVQPYFLIIFLRPHVCNCLLKHALLDQLINKDSGDAQRKKKQRCYIELHCAVLKNNKGTNRQEVITMRTFKDSSGKANEADQTDKTLSRQFVSKESHKSCFLTYVMPQWNKVFLCNINKSTVQWRMKRIYMRKWNEVSWTIGSFSVNVFASPFVPLNDCLHFFVSHALSQTHQAVSDKTEQDQEAHWTQANTPRSYSVPFFFVPEYNL